MDEATASVRFTEHALSLDTFNNPTLSLPRPGQPLAVTFRHDAVLTLDAPPTSDLTSP